MLNILYNTKTIIIHFYYVHLKQVGFLQESKYSTMKVQLEAVLLNNQ